jgi:uncharacterized protein (TIGR00251 family)
MNSPWIQSFASKTGHGVELWLHCQPGAKKTAWLGLHGDRLKVSLQAQASDGQANAALIVWIAKSLNTPRSSVEIVSGESSRMKKIRVHDLELIRAHETILALFKSQGQ